jgi:hypothetical protein
MALQWGLMLTASFSDFVATGGMTRRERDAAERAISEERRFWLPVLEAWATALREEGAPDPLMSAMLDGEIRRLRRLLCVPAPVSPEAADRRRGQTRERVRRHRERQRLKAAAQ